MINNNKKNWWSNIWPALVTVKEAKQYSRYAFWAMLFSAVVTVLLILVGESTGEHIAGIDIYMHLLMSLLFYYVQLEYTFTLGLLHWWH